MARIETEWDGDQNILKCPRCRDIWLHVIEVKVETDKTLTVIDHEGTRVVKATGSAEKNRGSITTITIWCEICRCCSTVEMAFHKGLIHTNTTPGKGFLDPESADPEDIWRD